MRSEDVWVVAPSGGSVRSGSGLIAGRRGLVIEDEVRWDACAEEPRGRLSVAGIERNFEFAVMLGVPLTDGVILSVQGRCGSPGLAWVARKAEARRAPSKEPV
jgi:hypothetical protein